MTLKTLVTTVAAAAAVGGAAAGMTSIASTTTAAAPAVAPVVWDIPMPAAPAPDLIGPLSQTVNALGAGGSFAGKSTYIQDLGRLTSRGVEAQYNSAVAKGYLPLTASVADVDQTGPTATANVTATLGTGVTQSMPLTFVEGPSPTGWQLSRQSLFDLAGLLSSGG